MHIFHSIDTDYPASFVLSENLASQRRSCLTEVPEMECINQHKQLLLLYSQDVEIESIDTRHAENWSSFFHAGEQPFLQKENLDSNELIFQTMKKHTFQITVLSLSLWYSYTVTAYTHFKSFPQIKSG